MGRHVVCAAELLNRLVREEASMQHHESLGHDSDDDSVQQLRRSPKSITVYKHVSAKENSSRACFPEVVTSLACHTHQKVSITA